MFNKKLLIYFSRTHLFIYYKDISLPIKIELEEGTIQSMEKVNTDWLQAKLKENLNKLKVKGAKAILILSKDIVFDKLLNSEDVADKEKEVQEFLGEIPLERDIIEYKEFVKEGNTLLTAANRNLYTILSSLLKENGVEVEWVLPEIVFNRIDFTKIFLSDLLKQKELLTYGNFLSEDSKKKPLNFKTIGAALIGVVVVGALIGGAAYLINNKNTDIIKNEVENNTPSMPTEVQTETVPVETVEELLPIAQEAREAVDITIFNGTGTPGFAGQIETTVNKGGYTTTSTANADNFNYTSTIISSSPDVNDQIISEVRDSLKSYLESFEIRKSLTGTNKIEITTGKILKVN